MFPHPLQSPISLQKVPRQSAQSEIKLYPLSPLKLFRVCTDNEFFPWAVWFSPDIKGTNVFSCITFEVPRLLMKDPFHFLCHFLTDWVIPTEWASKQCELKPIVTVRSMSCYFWCAQSLANKFLQQINNKKIQPIPLTLFVYFVWNEHVIWMKYIANLYWKKWTK